MTRAGNRLRTARAACHLVAAKAVVAAVPFKRWRPWVGAVKGDDAAGPAVARRLAAHIDRAAMHLPFECRCLPRSIALSWQLRRRRINHRVVIAARPAALRGGPDGLHAWLEDEAGIVLGDLPGPWHKIITL